MKLRKLIKNEKGQSELLSSTIMFPAMLMIIAGLLQVGMLINAKLLVNQSSFAGALAARTSTVPATSAKNAVIQYGSGTLPGWSTTKNLSVSTTVTGGPGIPNSEITVITTYRVPVIIDLIAPTGVTVYTVKGQADIALQEKG